MHTIWNGIDEIIRREADSIDDVLKNTPCPEYEAVADIWKHTYT